MSLTRLKLIGYVILVIPSLLVLCTIKVGGGKNWEKIRCDILRYKIRFGVPEKGLLYSWYYLMCVKPEFRAVYYMRVKYVSIFIKFFLPPMPLCLIPTPSSRIGAGLLIEHGNSTILQAESIGENLWVNQNVTVGFGRGGQPVIGNNVRIGTGAVVLGGITIGDNVNIGANAIVVDDVPSDCTVCSPKATIKKFNSPDCITPNKDISNRAYL